MQQHSRPVLFLLFILFLHPLFAQFDVHDSRWCTKPVFIDGADTEWDKPFHLYEPETGLMFGIANDQDKLYLCFESNEHQKIHKLMRAGWDIILSSKDKKNKFSATISFPGVQLAGSYNNRNNNPNMPGMEESKKEKMDLSGMVDGYRLRLGNVSCKGFVSMNGSYPLNQQEGLQMAVGSDADNNLIVEIAIPLKELSPNDLFQLKEMLLTVNVHALDASSFSGNHHSSSDEHEGGDDMDSGGGFNSSSSGGYGGHGGGGYGNHGSGGYGGHGGNHSGGTGFDRSTMLEKATMKQKFRLSKS